MKVQLWRQRAFWETASKMLSNLINTVEKSANYCGKASFKLSKRSLLFQVKKVVKFLTYKIA